MNLPLDKTCWKILKELLQKLQVVLLVEEIQTTSYCTNFCLVLLWQLQSWTRGNTSKGHIRSPNSIWNDHPTTSNRCVFRGCVLKIIPKKTLQKDDYIQLLLNTQVGVIPYLTGAPNFWAITCKLTICLSRGNRSHQVETTWHASSTVVCWCSGGLCFAATAKRVRRPGLETIWTHMKTGLRCTKAETFDQRCLQGCWFCVRKGWTWTWFCQQHIHHKPFHSIFQFMTIVIPMSPLWYVKNHQKTTVFSDFQVKKKPEENLSNQPVGGFNCRPKWQSATTLATTPATFRGSIGRCTARACGSLVRWEWRYGVWRFHRGQTVN